MSRRAIRDEDLQVIHDASVLLAALASKSPRSKKIVSRAADMRALVRRLEDTKPFCALAEALDDFVKDTEESLEDVRQRVDDVDDARRGGDR
jgi:hypothetical protein